jgi:hypothetical protein
MLDLNFALFYILLISEGLLSLGLTLSTLLFSGLPTLAFSFINMADSGENQQPEQGIILSLIFPSLCLHLHHLDSVLPFCFVFIGFFHFIDISILSLQLLQKAIKK